MPERQEHDRVREQEHELEPRRDAAEPVREAAAPFGRGSMPAVAPSVAAHARPTASELAFGSPRLPREVLIELVASQMHEAWRFPRFDAQAGTYEPRPKQTEDKAWSARNGGATEVDIANTAFADLPSDWQKENRDGATVAVDLVLAGARSGRAFDAAFIEDASATIHDKWLERNPWAEPHQKVPYAKLSEAEKEKDRVVLRTALDYYQNGRAQVPPR